MMKVIHQERGIFMARFCTKCGSMLTEQAKFCENCGASCAPDAALPVQSDQVPMMPEAQPQYGAYQQPQYQPTQYQQLAYPLQPDRKSHLGLGIAIVVIPLVLIAAAIVLFIIFNPFKGSGSSSPEELVEKLTYAECTDKYDADDILSVLYEYHYAKDDRIKSDVRETVEDLLGFAQENIAFLKEEYGDDYTVTTAVTKTRTYTDEDYQEVIRFLSEDYETDAIEEISIVTYDQTIKGSKGSEKGSSTVGLIKADGKWYLGLYAMAKADSDYYLD